MIKFSDLDSAINECHSKPNPTADTCQKLAAYYVIRDHMSKQEQEQENERYSFASPPMEGEKPIFIPNGSEFADAVNGRLPSEIMPLMAELMETLAAVNPRLYDAVMRKL